MEVAWVCYSGDSVDTIHPFQLNSHSTGGECIFGKCIPNGRWHYIEQDKVFLIEFKASWKPLPFRRHVFSLRTDGSYLLYEANDPIYQNEELWMPGSLAVANFLCRYAEPANVLTLSPTVPA